MESLVMKPLLVRLLFLIFLPGKSEVLLQLEFAPSVLPMQLYSLCIGIQISGSLGGIVVIPSIHCNSGR